MPPLGSSREGVSFPSGRSGWSPDPVVVADDVALAEYRIGRWQVPLNQARFIIAENIQSHFDEQTDYDHVPWKEWSPSYDARQENLGDILQQTYAMEYAATNPENFIVISHSKSAGAFGGGEVAIIGSNLPDYWIWHEEGLPTRKAPLPQRKFMGLDTEGEEQIFAVLDRYADGALIGTLVRGRAGQFGQPRGRGGRFAKNF